MGLCLIYIGIVTGLRPQRVDLWPWAWQAGQPYFPPFVWNHRLQPHLGGHRRGPRRGHSRGDLDSHPPKALWVGATTGNKGTLCQSLVLSFSGNILKPNPKQSLPTPAKDYRLKPKPFRDWTCCLPDSISYCSSTISISKILDLIGQSLNPIIFFIWRVWSATGHHCSFTGLDLWVHTNVNLIKLNQCL